MNNKIYRCDEIFCVLFSALLLMGLLNSCSEPDNPAAHRLTTSDGVIYLGQGWDMDERQRLSYTSFGSRVINYSWFIALENSNSQTLFRENTHMADLGFITESASQFNPDGLPVGMTRDSDGNQSWMGLTCAACHTGQISINGQPVRIDGGQSMINYTLFESELLAALKATYTQPEKWQRFMARLHQLEKNTDANITKQQLAQRIQQLEARYAMNATDVPYGYGRLDAFGQIFNAVAVDALSIPENIRSPDAPTSFPFLWDASHLDVVQWNASAPNKEPGPVAQNATTALAVYGTVEVQGHSLTYPSSIAIENLGYIQKEFYKLTSPQWPESLAGKLDTTLIAQGQKIYQRDCVQCHSVVNSKDPSRQLSAVVIPATQVGTDSRMVNNFVDFKVKTGELEGKHFALWFGKKFGAEAARLDVVMHVTTGALAHHPWDSLRAVIKEFASNKTAVMDDNISYYKARPINGIWAAAPYLHNGSVPTVYDLLLPAAQRPTQFFVGNRELDKIKLGNQTTEVANSSLFDTSLPGNSNAGHEYGTQMSEAERMALLEYIKSL